MLVLIPPPFLCVSPVVHDGDTIRCASGVRVRLAGVDANELDGSCHTTCAPMPAQAARAWLSRLIYRQTLTCQQVDVSYRRIVARCSVNGVDLSCASIASGAAAVWPVYWRRYGMEPCP